jgi:predicted nuclease of restriction endonuclease-like (RecB) superfamily
MIKIIQSKKSMVPSSLHSSIRSIIAEARSKVYRSINTVLVSAYWEIGRLIVEDEQKGKRRAEYGKAVLKELAEKLTAEFGKGFDESNLRYMRLFFMAFPIRDALRHELSWTHYRVLIRVENLKAREYYLNEAAAQNWSSRALERQINSLYYDRLLASKEKAPVEKEGKQKAGELAKQPQDFIRDPVVLEFLGLQSKASYRESDLESALITHLQVFLLELGNGFAFVARQQHIRTETADFFIDLVFYHFQLRCFILIDLKAGALSHQDVGQMDMYVRMYDDLKRQKGDNPTIGLILCTDKDTTIVKYSVLNEGKRLFASRYRLYLPSEKELKALIEQDRENISASK